ncbi:MAG: HAMP domain-containing protein [Acidobacteria bacterium]|nr:HAMP domain-containing protein [Acidobacteriota bacterium]
MPLRSRRLGQRVEDGVASVSRNGSVYGLRSRLLTLVLLAVVPALGLLMYTNWAQRQQQVEWVREDAKRLVRTVASTEDRYILGTRQLLMAIAETPVVRGGDIARCNKYLRILKSKNPLYTLVEMVGGDGMPICSSTKESERSSISDRPYFQQAMATGEFTISAYQIGRVSGRAIVTFAYPVHWEESEPQGVAIASHDLAIWVNQLSADLQLPAGATMTLFDRNGAILAGYPADQKVIGKQVDNVTMWSGVDAGQVRVTQGTTAIRAETPLIHGDQLAGTVRVELSAARAFAEYDRVFRRNAFLLGLVSLLAVLAAWMGSEVFVLRQTRALVATSHRLADGDLAARTGLAYGRDELGHLARVFDEMAASLDTHAAQLVDAERGLAAAGLASVLNITADAIVRVDPAVLDRPVTMLVAARAVGPLQAALATALAADEGAGSESLRVEARRADGTEFPAEVTLSRWVEAGQVSCTMVLRDITERVAAEQQQLAVQRQRAEVERLESLAVLAGGVAHDFNNLLVAVIGNACLGMEETPSGSALHRYFGEIEGAAQRAAGLSLQMLAYSGRSYVVARRVQVSEVVLETAQALQATLPPTLTLDVRVSRTLPDIDGDPAQLKQLLTNLVTNAVEAIGTARGMVTVTTGLATRPARGESGSAEGEHVYLKVTDTGPGIADELQPRIFEPFFSTKFTGRGLGLAVVSGIVRAHGGFVLVESVPGHGSTFTVMLPTPSPATADSRTRSSVTAA